MATQITELVICGRRGLAGERIYRKVEEVKEVKEERE
jgi:hypothetical protein